MQKLLCLDQNIDNVIKNTGSIARDVLACSGIGLGFVGASSAMFEAYHWYNEGLPKEEIYPASTLLVGNGVILLVFATRCYLWTVWLLIQDNFPINPRGIFVHFGDGGYIDCGLVGAHVEYRIPKGHARKLSQHQINLEKGQSETNDQKNNNNNHCRSQEQNKNAYQGLQRQQHNNQNNYYQQQHQ
jgi:hypothetical protein